MSTTRSTELRQLPRAEATRRAPQRRPRLLGSVRSRPRLLTALGVLSLFIGVSALVFSFVPGLAPTLLVGALIAAEGLLGVVHAAKLRTAKGWSTELATGGLATLYGLALILTPLAEAASLGLLVGIFFLGEGALRLGTAIQVRGSIGWGWLLTVPVLEIAMGLLVVGALSDGTVPLLGILLGIDLLVHGSILILVAKGVARERGLAPARARTA